SPKTSTSRSLDSSPRSRSRTQPPTRRARPPASRTARAISTTFRSATDAEHLDSAAFARGVLTRADLRVAVLARAPDRRDALGELRVGLAGAQRRLQVTARGREQARVQVAVRGEPRARAVAAERLADRRDDADLARAVAVAVAPRDLAAVAR